MRKMNQLIRHVPWDNDDTYNGRIPNITNEFFYEIDLSVDTESAAQNTIDYHIDNHMEDWVFDFEQDMDRLPTDEEYDDERSEISNRYVIKKAVISFIDDLNE